MGGKKVPKICDQCGIEFLVFKQRLKWGRGRFCSRNCADHYFALHHRIRKISWKDRFWSRVRITPGCWLWQGKLKNGYGSIRVLQGLYMVHRLSWELHGNLLPVGLKVLHKCDIRNCVNPDHLFLGTQRENVYDAIAKGRMHWGPNAPRITGVPVCL